MVPWKTLALVAVTGDEPERLALGPLPMRSGARRYASGFPFADDVLQGARVPEFLHQFDAVGLWHWPPEWFLDELYSTERRIRVGPVVPFEAIPQVQPPRGAPDAVLWEVSSGFLLQGTDGKPVDAYWSSTPAAPAKPHVWMCDVRNPEYARAYVEALEFVFSVHYKRTSPTLLFPDNTIRRPYFATAPNAPVVDEAFEADYRDGWAFFLHEAARRVLPCWGNTNVPDAFFVPSLALEFWEHSFEPGRASAENADTVRAFATQVSVGLGWEGSPPTDALALRTAVGPDWPGRIYLLVCRTGTPFGLWYPGPGVVG